MALAASTTDDVDCDGIASSDDCDDEDPTSLAIANDGDCDGVLTAADCDDADPALLAVAVDGDCDGVLTADDCDDTDATVFLCPITHAGGGVMLGLPAGTFEMGCTAGMSDCYPHESPAHSVTLTNDFFIGETEVTQARFEIQPRIRELTMIKPITDENVWDEEFVGDAAWFLECDHV